MLSFKKYKTLKTKTVKIAKMNNFKKHRFIMTPNRVKLCIF